MKQLETRLAKLENTILGVQVETFELPFECTEDDKEYLLQKRFKGAATPKNSLVIFLTNYTPEFKAKFSEEKALYRSKTT